jgi:hypothetical protein
VRGTRGDNQRDAPPGVPAEGIFYLCKEEFQKRGLPWQLPRIGHSFGVELHESR